MSWTEELFCNLRENSSLLSMSDFEDKSTSESEIEGDSFDCIEQQKFLKEVN